VRNNFTACMADYITTNMHSKVVPHRACASVPKLSDCDP